MFLTKIVQWFNSNKRDLPWRQTATPYRVWLSEIILQQTRVAQGTPYYHKILAQFPDVEALANAEEGEVLSLWQGLGYYSRGRNLHKCAQQIVSDYDGQFPSTAAELLKLKGIGKYTAAAIASICFNEKIPVVDGNVYRVLSRYLNLDTDISSSIAYKVFEKAAFELMEDEQPGVFNQAMMEFGALQCVPKSPNCLQCPLMNSCEAFRLGLVKDRPVKTKKVKIKKRFFNYFVLSDQKGLLIRKREEGDIWQGLFDFPQVEAKEPDSALQGPLYDQLKELKVEKQFSSSPIKHVLTHQVIMARFHHFIISNTLKELFIENYDLKYFTFAQLPEVPKPVLISNYLKSEVNSLDLF